MMHLRLSLLLAVALLAAAPLPASSQGSPESVERVRERIRSIRGEPSREQDPVRVIQPLIVLPAGPTGSTAAPIVIDRRTGEPVFLRDEPRQREAFDLYGMEDRLTDRIDRRFDDILRALVRDDAPLTRARVDSITRTLPSERVIWREVPSVDRVERALLETGLFQTVAVNFEFDRSELLPPGRETLRAIGEVMDRYEQMRIRVEGHTDWIGPPEYNQALSERRAAAARSFIVRRLGIGPERVETIGYGEARPVASNQTPTGRTLNRRVAFRVLNPEEAVYDLPGAPETEEAEADTTIREDRAPVSPPDTTHAARPVPEEEQDDEVVYVVEERAPALRRAAGGVAGWHALAGARMDDEADQALVGVRRIDRIDGREAWLWTREAALGSGGGTAFFVGTHVQAVPAFLTMRRAAPYLSAGLTASMVGGLGDVDLHLAWAGGAFFEVGPFNFFGELMAVGSDEVRLQLGFRLAP